MKVETPNKGQPSGSQAKIVFGHFHAPWSTKEIEVLRALAPHVVTAAMIAEHFPNRTEKAVKSRLGAQRAEMGLARRTLPQVTKHAPPKLTILHPQDPGADDGEYRRFCQRTALSSRVLLERIAACG